MAGTYGAAGLATRRTTTAGAVGAGEVSIG